MLGESAAEKKMEILEVPIKALIANALKTFGIPRYMPAKKSVCFILKKSM
jgi:hypothetical protein